MVEIRILSVGKSKERYWNEACAEYAKRLSRYCRLSFHEVQDEKTPDRAQKAECEKIKNTEGERLLRLVRDQDYVIALAIEGKMPDSVELSFQLEQLMTAGKSCLCFVIGGSLGLSEQVMKRADKALSFSRMTFPHQMMRVILLEQIYRSFRIMNNEPYHK